MKAVIDRFEGEFAVIELEDGRCVNLPSELVPGAREGDIVVISTESGADRLEKNKVRLNKLFGK